MGKTEEGPKSGLKDRNWPGNWPCMRLRMFALLLLDSSMIERYTNAGMLHGAT